MTKSLTNTIALLGLFFAGSAQSASAGYMTYISGAEPSQTYFDGDISNSDLINIGSAALASATQTPGPAGGSLDGAHDGSAASLSNDDFFTSAQTLTFNLNLDPASGGSATGYTISKIQSIAGWGSAGFAAQNFSLYVTTILNPTFTEIGSGFDNESGIVDDFSGNTPQSTETTLTGDSAGIATGVTAVEFIYAAPSTSGGTVLREVDVFGAPTVAVPEPSTTAMLAGACALLMLGIRHRA